VAASRINVVLYRETGEIEFLPNVYGTGQSYASMNSAFLRSRHIGVAVTVQDASQVGQSNVPVYVVTGDTWAGYVETTGGSGQVIFNLPAGNYRFMAVVNSIAYWSGSSTTCPIPRGCTSNAEWVERLLASLPEGTRRVVAKLLRALRASPPSSLGVPFESECLLIDLLHNSNGDPVVTTLVVASPG
jgi:hypothetical protein